MKFLFIGTPVVATVVAGSVVVASGSTASTSTSLTPIVKSSPAAASSSSVGTAPFSSVSQIDNALASASAISSGKFVVSPTINGEVPLHASFEISKGLEKIPVTTGKYTDWAGAFRFICGGNGKVKADDPVILPGQPGKSHLHQPWGNVDFSASTTPASLHKSADTNCNQTAYSLNRSLYWMPAVVSDQAQVVQPDLVVIYYKRKSQTSAGCQPGSSTRKGTCVGLPNQIRFVFGWDPTRPTAKVSGASWYCESKTTSAKRFTNLDDVFANGCRAGDQLVANTVAPDCWDGKYLDTPDHRSHMAWPSYGSWGYEKCPSTHPYVIPQEENKAMFTVTSDMYRVDSKGVIKSRLKLASDAMLPGSRPGETLHADYMEGWVWEAKQAWQTNCIEGKLSCSAGDLGNGTRLVGSAKPSYGWTNPSPRIPLPK